MSALNSIKNPVENEIKEFEKHFSSLMKSNVPLLGIITSYVLKRKGKMLRPLLVFLSAKINGNINQSTHTAAAMIELLHTASLIHDDVVDESYMRRGFFSINALWKSKLAVLMGDFLLSKGLLIAIDNNEFEILRIMSDAVRQLSEGELLQIQKARKLNVNEKLYFDIIRQKTASLIASCTACGAYSTKVSKELVANMKDFGENLGMAFQIKDDLLDFEAKNNSGKPSGNDLQEKKLTLPLIHALQICQPKEKRQIISLINKKHTDSKSIEFILDFVKSNGGIVYATECMNQYKEKALQNLEIYESCDAKTALIELSHYIVNRNK